MNSTDGYDVIVIGSGMGGMTTAAALSRFDHKVLLLEQAPHLGGLTHAFSRGDFDWDVGLHYCGMFRPDQAGGKLLDWLSGGTIEFRSIGTVYDNLHFPDEFELAVGRPVEALKQELKDRFPEHHAAVDAYFEALESADEAMLAASAERTMPEPFRSAHRWWNSRKIEKYCTRTTNEVVADYVSDPRLAAVLTAQWLTYGGLPDEASFGLHARIIRHYLDGAGYPAGGASSIAKGLIPTVESAGGGALVDTPVSAVLIEGGEAVGVRTNTGEEYHAPAIVSAMGAGETIKRLLPADIQSQDWATEIADMRPSLCHFETYLGFEGDIAKHGATRFNHWFFESWDVRDILWSDTSAPIRGGFVSFPTLKDEDHNPGPSHRHTGQFMILADWSTVAPFAEGGANERPDEWKAFKKGVETRMLEYFAAKFPALAEFIVHNELATPLSTARYTAHEKGGFYGLETTPRRVLSEALSPRTPVPGLFLSGQDVMTPGIAGALFGGVLSAASIDPRVFTKLRG
ncbi:MAG: NAD(P)/FAD-dependent oxidoreductase [Bacteroidota bacterium]